MGSSGSSDAGLAECVEHGTYRAREPRVSGLEPHRRAFERIAVLNGRCLRDGCLEHPVDVREHGLEQGAIVLAQPLGTAEFSAKVS